MGWFGKKENKEEPAPVKKKSWTERLKSGLGKTSEKLTSGIAEVLIKKRLDDETLEELEDVLIMSDMGVEVASQVVDRIRRQKFEKDIDDVAIKAVIADEITEILTPVSQSLTCSHTPEVIVMCGVNGSGKTTTIGKLAQRYQLEGKKVVVGACDTFRAAAVEQLEVWAERVGALFVSGEPGADAASVAYKAVETAQEQKADIVLLDTAGRLENKQNLMEELEKIIRVVQKLDKDAPHERIIVLDATTGQNANQQVQVFLKYAQLTGMVVTKLDGTAKGGVVVSLAKQFKLPIYAVGVGETVDDLDHFDAKIFAKNLVDQ